MKEKQAGSRKLAEAAKAYMEARIEEHFSLRKMADTLYVNQSHLLRTFKQHFGLTPLAYHHLLRCEKAKELLERSSMSISAVGEAVGFVSSSHFAHIFHKTVGCTPSEYRRAHAPEKQPEAEE